MNSNMFERTPDDDRLELLWGRSSEIRVIREEILDLIVHTIEACEFTEEEKQNGTDQDVILTGFTNALADYIIFNNLDGATICSQLSDRVIQKQHDFHNQ